MSKEVKKMEYVQGIRGICCVLVCLFHFLLAFLPQGYIGWGSNIELELQGTQYFSFFPYSVFLNTSLPLFLLISLVGFTIASRYFQTQDVDFLRNQARKRYLRLMPSVLVATLISYAISAFSLNYNVVVGEATHNSWLILSSYAEPNSWFGAIFSGLFRVFLIRDGDYCSVLWCYHIIFLGSFMVYGFLALFGTSKKLYVPCVLLSLGLWYTNNTNFLCLVGGVIAADITVNYKKTDGNQNGVGAILVATGIFVGCLPVVILPASINEGVVSTIGVVFILVGIEKSQWLQKVLSNKLLLMLGNYSSSVVLVHFSILVSITCYTYYRMELNFGTPLFSVFMAFLSFVISTGLFVYLFYHFVEVPLLKLVNK